MVGALPLVRGLVIVAALSLALALVLARPLGAQGNRRTSLTVTGLPLSATTTTAADFDANAVSIGSFSFTVDLTTNAGGGGFSPRVTTVDVRCGSPCPASGTLPVGALEWRRSDLGTWNALTTAYATVESRTATFNGTDDPWGNTIFWRYALSWASSPPTAATAFYLQLQLTVAAP
jgi:hypothetical protein